MVASSNLKIIDIDMLVSESRLWNDEVRIVMDLIGARDAAQRSLDELNAAVRSEFEKLDKIAKNLRTIRRGEVPE